MTMTVLANIDQRQIIRDNNESYYEYLYYMQASRHCVLKINKAVSQKRTNEK